MATACRWKWRTECCLTERCWEIPCLSHIALRVIEFYLLWSLLYPPAAQHAHMKGLHWHWHFVKPFCNEWTLEKVIAKLNFFPSNTRLAQGDIRIPVGTNQAVTIRSMKNGDHYSTQLRQTGQSFDHPSSQKWSLTPKGSIFDPIDTHRFSSCQSFSYHGSIHIPLIHFTT